GGSAGGGMGGGSAIGGGSGGSGGANDAGCSANTNIDLQNCGACGHSCTALPGVIASAVHCTSGRCDVTGACASGRGHCSSNADDGCEVDFTTASNCGACARTCGTTAPACSAVLDGGRECVGMCTSPAMLCGS